MITTTNKLTDLIRANAHPLTGTSTDYDPLIERIDDARFVLIGEASHGTHEFYQTRAEITQRLIQEKGFNAVAVEADWPDAYRINRYVKGKSDDAESNDALANFTRFPSWMWRNTVVLEFVSWLRGYNDSLTQKSKQVGFYGLDLYSLHSSIHAVLEFLDKIDPEAAKRARYRYSCFEHFGEDSQSYGYAASFGLTQPCEQEAVNQLLEMQRSAGEYAQTDGRLPEDEFFFAEQNARLIKNAEQYYRSMFQGRVSSWNLRDRHMAETLDTLVDYLDRQIGNRTKVVVWAHNSHLGDARATYMHEIGELNLGQLVREKYNHDAVLIGFSTYTGNVTAAYDWGTPAERQRVRSALGDSYEELFHNVGISRFLLILAANSEVSARLQEQRLERAIGVIYRPETERISHYFEARLSEQFDVIIHLDETRAIEPLEPTEQWHTGEEVPETFPSSF